jgi:hypothetical protein
MDFRAGRAISAAIRQRVKLTVRFKMNATKLDFGLISDDDDGGVPERGTERERERDKFFFYPK